MPASPHGCAAGGLSGRGGEGRNGGGSVYGHAPLPIPLERTQYEENPNLSADGVDAYFAGMQAFREHYTGPVRMRIGLEVEYFEGCEEETARSLDLYGPRMEDGLISVHNLLVDGCYLNLDYRHNIIAAVKAVGARKLGEIYYRTLIRSVTADLGPWRPRHVGHPTLLGRCGRLFPEFYDNLPVMEEFILVVKEQECALELNTSGVLYPDDCGQIYGEALLPLIQSTGCRSPWALMPMSRSESAAGLTCR